MAEHTIGPDGRPHAFIDLPPEKFPVELTAFVGDEIIWRRTIEPYSVVDIPGPAPDHKGHIWVRLVLRRRRGHRAGSVLADGARRA